MLQRKEPQVLVTGGFGDQRMYSLSPTLSPASHCTLGLTSSWCTPERLYLTLKGHMLPYWLVKATGPASPSCLSPDTTMKGVTDESAGASGTCCSTWLPSFQINWSVAMSRHLLDIWHATPDPRHTCSALAAFSTLRPTQAECVFP